MMTATFDDERKFFSKIIKSYSFIIKHRLLFNEIVAVIIKSSYKTWYINSQVKPSEGDRAGIGEFGWNNALSLSERRAGLFSRRPLTFLTSFYRGKCIDRHRRVRLKRNIRIRSREKRRASAGVHSLFLQLSPAFIIIRRSRFSLLLFALVALYVLF